MDIDFKDFKDADLIDSDLDDNSGSDEDDGPNEDLIVNGATGTVWLVKIPKQIMEVWGKIDEDGIPLAKLRVYNEQVPPVIHMILPNEPSLGAMAGGVLVLDARPSLLNHFVVSEPQPSAGRTGSQLEARADQQFNVRPLLTEGYTSSIAQRHREANAPKRQLQRLDESQTEIRQRASGVGNAGGFSNFVKQKPTAKNNPSGQFERAARIPKNELLDMLFGLYQKQPKWGMKQLRAETSQPEVYLKEVLGEIAILNKSGPNTNLWTLQPSYAANLGIPTDGNGAAAPGAYPQGSAGASGSGTGDAAMDDDSSDDDEDDDDDDDDDMEEVMG